MSWSATDYPFFPLGDWKAVDKLKHWIVRRQKTSHAARQREATIEDLTGSNLGPKNLPAIKRSCYMGAKPAIATLVTLVFLLAFTAAAVAALAKPTNVRVGLPGRLSFNWPLYVAVERGFFRQEGLDAELIVLRSSTVQTQAILAGDLQVNLNSVDSTARAVVAGAPLKFVGSAQEKPAFRLIAAKEIKGWMIFVAKC